MDYHFNSKEDIKLIILTVIKSFTIPVPNSMIVDTVLTHSFAEYIDIQQYLYELTDSQLVTYYVENDVRYYSLTEKGKETVGYFSSQVPKTVRERLFTTAREKSKELLTELSVQAEYYPENEMEYAVVLKIVDRGYDMINLKLNVGSEALAKSMCGRFKRDPESFYTGVLALLIDENSEI